MTTMAKIKVLLADDAVICRAGWRAILSTAPEMEVVGEVSVAVNVPDAVATLRPDVLLMDLKWNGDTTAGHSAIREIRETDRQVRIIACTGYEDLIRESRLSGADAALTKEFTREELLDTIRKLAARRGPMVGINEGTVESNPLTGRELEILQLVAQYLQDSEIAGKLGISDATVGRHLGNIFAKLDVHRRMQAVERARFLGLL
jgi:DNA-binding NarL/FixJ family response regulator